MMSSSTKNKKQKKKKNVLKSILSLDGCGGGGGGGCGSGCGGPGLGDVYEPIPIPNPKPKLPSIIISSTLQNPTTTNHLQPSSSSSFDQFQFNNIVCEEGYTSTTTTSTTSSLTNNNEIQEEEEEEEELGVGTWKCSGICSKLRDSVAVVKESEDPLEDFKASMKQMVVEKQIRSDEDLRALLDCFLHLNSPFHHHLILRAFSHISADHHLHQPPFDADH